DGEVLITGAGIKEVRLKPGDYKLRATKDGKLLRQEVVSIKRGGRQVVKVVLLPAEVKAPLDWRRSVAALPPEQQVEAVAAKLKELNPGFDGKVDHEIEDGAVVALMLRTEKVSDVSPIRALQGLRALMLDGGDKGLVADLRPLRGLALASL